MNTDPTPQDALLYYRLGHKTKALRCAPGSIGARVIAEGRGHELAEWLGKKNDDNVAFENSFEGSVGARDYLRGDPSGHRHAHGVEPGLRIEKQGKGTTVEHVWTSPDGRFRINLDDPMAAKRLAFAGAVMSAGFTA